MRTIDELGISKTPWKSKGQFVVSKNRRTVALSNYNDARLIAAAPELYEALRKMQECFDYIRSTAWFMDANFVSIQKMTKAQNEAKSALAKASGEEVE